MDTTAVPSAGRPHIGLGHPIPERLAVADPAARTVDVLTHGELTLDGRLIESSNNAMVGTVTVGTDSLRCVYKPIRGERRLWDFPRGQLARREVAAYVVAGAAGWQVAPPTVLRDGPFGLGMVQQWVEAAAVRFADIFPAGDVPSGWLPVFAAEDADGNPLVVAHADIPELTTIAVFDVVANNADRKASHLLGTADGAVYGVDHGLTFHSEPKLRTILWGWAGRRIPSHLLDGLHRLRDRLDGPLASALAPYLTGDEIDALRARVAALTTDPRFPLPPDDRTPIPWPPL